jgi:hypothetical protein
MGKVCLPVELASRWFTLGLCSQNLVLRELLWPNLYWIDNYLVSVQFNFKVKEYGWHFLEHSSWRVKWAFSIVYFYCFWRCTEYKVSYPEYAHHSATMFTFSWYYSFYHHLHPIHYNFVTLSTVTVIPSTEDILQYTD